MQLYQLPHIALENFAKTYPEKIFLTWIDEEYNYKNISYKEMFKRSNLLAKRLREKGISYGERVILIFQNALDFSVAYFACNMCGAIAVPFKYPMTSLDLVKLENVINNVNTKFVITEKEKTYEIKRKFAELSSLENVNILCEKEISHTTYEIEKGIELFDIALIQYTSGSTGGAKGVAITYNSILSNICGFVEKYLFDSDSRFVSWMPYYHNVGLVLGILTPLLVGGRSILITNSTFMKKPMIWLKALSDFKATHTFAPNFSCEILADLIQERAGFSLKYMKCWICGAEPIKYATIQKFYKQACRIGFPIESFTPSYGLTESTLIVTAHKAGEKLKYVNVEIKGDNILSLKCREQLEIDRDVNQSDNSILISNGKPIREHELTIRGETGEILPPFKIGNVCFSGNSLAEGYWDTDTRIIDFRTNTYLMTGDVGFVDEEGEVYITGRSKEIIILHGEKYYPLEIEKSVHIDNKELENNITVALGIDNGVEEELIIVQELNDKHINKENLKFLSNKIRYNIQKNIGLVVKHIFFVKTGTIPRTELGKIKRQELSSLLKCKELDSINILEEKLDDKIVIKENIQNDIVKNVANLLGMNSDEILVDRSFMEMGLDSHSIIQLAGWLKSIYDIEIPIVTIFNYNTIGQLTEKILEILKRNEGTIEDEMISENKLIQLLQEELER